MYANASGQDMSFRLPDPNATAGPSTALSAQQVHTYLTHIGLPPEQYPPKPDPTYFTLLLQQHLIHIPYENLSLHYGQSRRITLDPQALYKKVITDARGRGGFCFELCILFRHLLAALGFSVYTTAVRIRPRVNNVPQGPYIGFVHCVNLVNFDDGGTYYTDVSFGGDGPTKPLPLIDGFTMQNLGSQEVRLRYDVLSGQSDAGRRFGGGGKHWIYEYRNGVDKPWNAYYAFGTNEFMDNDLEWLCEAAMSEVLSFQMKSVLAVKFIGTAGGEALETDQRIKGKLMLADAAVKRNMGGKTEVLKVCQNEEERVDAINDLFGITLLDREKEAIRGRSTAIAKTSIANVRTE